jgi:hypothetical protein
MGLTTFKVDSYPSKRSLKKISNSLVAMNQHIVPNEIPPNLSLNDTDLNIFNQDDLHRTMALRHVVECDSEGPRPPQITNNRAVPYAIPASNKEVGFKSVE